jgi:hypothetical protein
VDAGLALGPGGAFLPSRLRLLILEKLAAYFWRKQWGEHKEKVGGGITPYRPVL